MSNPRKQKYVLLCKLASISKIYAQGDTATYADCIPSPGEIWTHKDGTVLPLKVGDIYVTEFANRALEEAIIHEILEKGQVSSVESLIPEDYRIRIYYKREPILNAHAADLAKCARSYETHQRIVIS